MSVEISPDIEAMCRTLVETGRYGDENQVLGEALRLLQRRDELDRGEGIDADVVFDRMKKKAADLLDGNRDLTVTANSDAEALLKEFIGTGKYRDENEVLNEALSLFKRRDEIHTHVQIGIDQLERGETVSGEEVFRELKNQAARLLDGDA